MASIRLSFPYGDTAKVCVHIVDTDGEAIDPSLYAQITFKLLTHTDNTDAEALFIGTLTGGAIKILNPSNDGVVEVTIPLANTVSMMIGQPYYWKCTLTDGAGQESTPVYGPIFAESPFQS